MILYICISISLVATFSFEGPKIGVLDVVTDNGSTFIVLGSETVGMIFLYSVNTTTGVPVPTFEAAIRAGRTDFVWQELYDLDEAGDAGISKVGYVQMCFILETRM